jgi:hypothetical protein
MKKRKQITEIFTPRLGEVNQSMYVPRPTHEKKLLRSLKRYSHTLIFGESGNGKSWLYKKVLDYSNIPYVVANCGNASRLKSITQEIGNCIIAPGTAKKLGFSEAKKAELNALFAKGTLAHDGDYEIKQEEPLLAAFKAFGEVAVGRKIIVLDNLEFIFSSSELMDELANILVLLDDQRFAQHNVNILIVGTPHDVMKYFRETKNVDSVANRIEEIPKVSGLNDEQAKEIISRGFKLLEVKILEQSLANLADHIWHITLGIAQRIHEYCEVLAYEIEENEWKYEVELLNKADKAWLDQGLRQSYQAIEVHLNSRETTVARKNQVIYCIGKMRAHQLDANVIDGMIRKEFPGDFQNSI